MDKNDENLMVKHPNHYNIYDIEVLDMMAAIWGNAAVALWCKMTAFKYRMRMGYKKDVDIEFDFKKEQECLELMRKYQAKIKNDEQLYHNINNKLFESENINISNKI